MEVQQIHPEYQSESERQARLQEVWQCCLEKLKELQEQEKVQ